MNPDTWRYIDSGLVSGPDNMGIDEAMLESHLAGETPPTLRVYGWQPSAVSLGRFQRADSSLDLAACRHLGIDVVRRPTGGRAILHTVEEVTFSLVVSVRRLGTTGVMGSYRALAGGIIAGLRSLGLDARLVERSSRAPTPGVLDPACFAVKARCDLVVGASKLVGSAQVQRHGVILQQNSLPLRIHLDDWRAVFRRSDAPPDAAGLCEVAARCVEYPDVAAALREGFASAFGVTLHDSGLTERELALARDLAPKTIVA
jgi:lipoate-protein ligase A